MDFGVLGGGWGGILDGGGVGGTIYGSQKLGFEHDRSAYLFCGACAVVGGIIILAVLCDAVLNRTNEVGQTPHYHHPAVGRDIGSCCRQRGGTFQQQMTLNSIMIASM